MNVLSIRMSVRSSHELAKST